MTRMGIRMGKEWGAASGGAKRQATRPPPLPAVARVPRLPGKGKVVGVVTPHATMANPVTKEEAAEQVGEAEVARRAGLPYEHVGAFVPRGGVRVRARGASRGQRVHGHVAGRGRRLGAVSGVATAVSRAAATTATATTATAAATAQSSLLRYHACRRWSRRHSERTTCPSCLDALAVWSDGGTLIGPWECSWHDIYAIIDTRPSARVTRGAVAVIGVGWVLVEHSLAAPLT